MPSTPARPTTPHDLEFEPLPRPAMLADGVYDKLRSLLVSGRIAPNEKIKIDLIARQLGVSNTPIRQALGRLEADALVYQEPHRGFIAARLPDSASVLEIYEVRGMIEPSNAAKAAQNRMDDDPARLRRILSPGADGATGLLDADEEFHLAIAKLARNAVATDVLDRMMLRARPFRNMYSLPDAGSKTTAEHEAIIVAIEAGAADQAAEAMSYHLSSASSRIQSLTNTE